MMLPMTKDWEKRGLSLVGKILKNGLSEQTLSLYFLIVLIFVFVFVFVVAEISGNHKNN